MLHVFIGCDEVETIAFHVLANSIRRHASVPVSITPLWLKNLDTIYFRKHDSKQSNEFSYSRFLVPYLCGYSGMALFIDCDMLVRCDIKELFDQFDPHCTVQCVQHDYIPKDSIKYLGNVQYAYPCKNWSSLMLFNNSRCRELSPLYIAQATPAELHRMHWAEEIGNLDADWNWLVGEYEYNPMAKILHWTVGGPWFEDYEDCDYADDWYAEFELMTHAENKARRLINPS